MKSLQLVLSTKIYHSQNQVVLRYLANRMQQSTQQPAPQPKREVKREEPVQQEYTRPSQPQS